PQRHRGAHLVAAQIADGAADERALTAATERLANHSVDPEPRVDIRSSDCPATGLPLNDDAAGELRAEAASEHVASPRCPEPSDVDAVSRHSIRDDVRPRRVVRVQAARAHREDEQDRRKPDYE